MRVYSLYLSTLSTTNPPVSKTNLAQVKWNVNWREIFGNRTGECRCRIKLISNSANTLAWANNVGSLRASFASSTSNTANGTNIGFVRPQSDFTQGSTFTYLDCDTITSNGTSIIIPNTNTDFTIRFLNNSEAQMTNVPEYQVWMYFDVDDEKPDTDNKIYNPR